MRATSGERRETGRTSERAVTDALGAMREIMLEVRATNRAVEQQLGLSGAQLFVLEELAREPAASLNELAARTGTRHSSVSTVVARLVEAGYVTRQPSREDGRRVLLGVTARGRALLRTAPLSAQARLLAAARALPATELAALGEGLTAWCAAFKAHHAAAGPRERTGRRHGLAARLRAGAEL